jgi:hypothetical protein
MAQNLTFMNTKVRSFSLDFLEVLWEIKETELDPMDFLFYVLRSESPMGPFDVIAGPFDDHYRFVDNKVNLLHRWRQVYYKIRSVQKVDSSNAAESDAFTFANDPDLIAEEVQRLERLLWNEYAGTKCFVFPIRTFGKRCQNCYDGPEKGKGFTGQRRRSHCVTCYDTSFVRGYYSPIEIFIQIDPSAISVQNLPITERGQKDTTARMPNFPIMKPRDIIVEMTNKRWRVVKVTPTERLRAIVHQELVLHEIIKGDVEYELPIRVENLREFEPSPIRNFLNPQDLQSFETQAIHDIFAVYGPFP